MKAICRILIFAALLITALVVGGCSTWMHEASVPNQLTAAEKSAGWVLLFDGKSLNGWRSYGKATAPEQGWVVTNGILNCVAEGHGGDLITTAQFTDFDFQWDWRIPAHANNGIKYEMTEQRPGAPGQEYQMVDDSIDAAKPAKRSTASFYDVLAPAADKPLRAVGEWNHSRVLVLGNHVEHWLNGAKVLEYEFGSAELKAAIAKSKFAKSPGFGEKITGPILLTEHHDAAEFRSLKILVLK